MRKVFISYARENRPIVDQLVEQLSILGCQTWLDSSLHGGQNWWDEVLRRIADCEAFIAIISRGALNSVACQCEFDWAEALGKPVLPIVVEPNPPPFPRRVSERQVIDYSDSNQRDRTALMVAGSLAALPAPPLPKPLPEPPPAPLSYLTDLIDLVSQRTFLEHDRQREIVVQLEPALRSLDPEERRGGRDTLERFNSREDLFADVHRAIAQLRQSESGADVARDTSMPEGQGGPPSRLVRAFYPQPGQALGQLSTGAYTPWILRIGACLIDVIPPVVVVLTGYLVAFDHLATGRLLCHTGGYCVTELTGLGNFVLWAGWLLALAYTMWNYGYRQGSTGSSIGKSVLKFKVVDEWSGQPIGFWRSIARVPAHVMDVPFYIGIFWPIVDDKRQTFSDKIMSTVCLPII